MSQAIDDPLTSGLAALQRHDWTVAFERLRAADAAGGLSAKELESLAEAAWWTGHPEECVRARERAYGAYVEAGDQQHAAQVALVLAADNAKKRSTAIAMSWYGRAEQLLEHHQGTAAYGSLCLIRSLLASSTGKLDEALEFARQAAALGAVHGDRDLQAYGAMAQGAALLAKGELAKGLALVDESTLAAVSGELGLMATGTIYCNTIGTCRSIGDFGRASEWTDAATLWCERESIKGFPGVCRVHRAEIMARRGDWAQAEQEVRRACTELERFDLNFAVAEGLYEIGEIRLRMGDLAAAEEAFRQAHELGMTPEPGMSLLQFAGGDVVSAAVSIKRALVNQPQELQRVRYLPAQVEIGLAAGDLESARETVNELEAIAAKAGGGLALGASAHCARGALALFEADLVSADRSLRAGWQLWQDLEAPYEAARARVLMAASCRAQGDEPGARLELQAARTAFERLGARRDARIVTQLLGGAGEVGVGPATAERVTTTFLFTDIVKSTNLVEAIGDEAWQELMRWHDHTLRSLIAEHVGEEIRHAGDGLVASFRDPTKAVECAVAILRRLAQHRQAHGFALQLRVGVHTTAVNRRGLDYAGKGIHEAARIGALAEGGEILASAGTLAHTTGQFRGSEPRAVTLKGISEPVQVMSIDWR